MEGTQPLTLCSSGARQRSAPVVEGTAHDGVLARLQHHVAVDKLLDSPFAVSHQAAKAQLVATGEGGPENHDAQIQQVAVHGIRPPVPRWGEGSHVTRELPHRVQRPWVQSPSPALGAAPGSGVQAWVLAETRATGVGEMPMEAHPQALQAQWIRHGVKRRYDRDSPECFCLLWSLPAALVLPQLTCCPPGRGQTPGQHAPTPSAMSPSLVHWPCWGTCPAHAPHASLNGACRYPPSQNTCGEAVFSACGVFCSVPLPSMLQVTQPRAAGTATPPAPRERRLPCLPHFASMSHLPFLSLPAKGLVGEMQPRGSTAAHYSVFLGLCLL